MDLNNPLTRPERITPQITVEGEVAVTKRVSIALVMVLGAGLATPSSPSTAASSKIKAAGSQSDGFRWDPSSRSIGKGDRIVWTNPTGQNHTVSAYGGNWSKSTQLGSGEKTRKKFGKQGTFRFRCLVSGHSSISDGRCVGMCGLVVVR